MASATHSAPVRRLGAIACAVLMFAVIVHVMATGVSILAGMTGPGIWGYLGAVGWLGLVGPLPILLLGSRGAGRVGDWRMPIDNWIKRYGTATNRSE